MAFAMTLTGPSTGASVAVKEPCGAWVTVAAPPEARAPSASRQRRVPHSDQDDKRGLLWRASGPRCGRLEGQLSRQGVGVLLQLRGVRIGVKGEEYWKAIPTPR